MSIQKETQSDRVNNSGSEFSDHVRFEPASQPSRSVVIYYYVTDSLGTPWRMVDASGTVVWAATYSAFGEATISVNVVDQPLRMPGQYYDQESGLHYNLARYYDPSIGRYLSVDPLRDAEDYAYANSNPLKYADPTGQKTTITISRDTYTTESLTGTISVTSDKVTDKFTGFTLEDARAGKKRDKDPIPAGTYDAFLRKDHDPNRIELKGLLDYENIQIHTGNTAADVEGCFAVGKSRGVNNVGNSKSALDSILDIIQKDKSGEIEVVVVGAPKK